MCAYFACISCIYAAFDLRNHFNSYEPLPHAVSSSLDEGSPMSDLPTKKPVCVVVGVGPGNGSAFARRFAAEGYAVALVARSTGLTSTLAQELPVARAYACDVGDLTALERTFALIESDLGSVDVLIYNAGKGVWGSAEEVTFQDFEAAWRTNTFGAFAAARCVVPAMKRRGAGNIIFIGATASRRGGAKTAAFASAKAAQRSLAESLARSLGPSRIHVSLIIIDGIVDEPSVRTRLADKLDSFFVKPDDVADTAVMLTRQKPSAWTFELEARPFGETW
jgi:NAD(P)-dependent dehydrogenase (short-subunit alcohol dehydrogenase family)